jgi:ubiquinone/menaquinone biosynthesis C-methylase UbiE
VKRTTIGLGLTTTEHESMDRVSFYRDRIVPHLVDISMRQATLAPYRRRLIPAAEGRVLEIGVGSGVNLPFYAERASNVIGLDPSPKLLAMAREPASQARTPVELLEGSAEAIPLPDKSIDTVVTTWTLCTVPDPLRALAEAHRVLVAQGRLLFVEHGRSPEAGVRRWQDRLTPLWRHIAGGCHLNRPVRQLVEDAGFRIERIDSGYMKGPKVMTFMYEGCARPA